MLRLFASINFDLNRKISNQKAAECWLIEANIDFRLKKPAKLMLTLVGIYLRHRRQRQTNTRVLLDKSDREIQNSIAD